LFLGQEEDGKDIIEILEQNKKQWAKKIRRFQLQKMAVGVEVAVGTFFNGNDFIYPINVNFEHKKLFPGDIGPYTGEMGTLMYSSPPNEIFKNTLLKMKNDLAKSGYVGYIDVNCIANSKGIFPLEFTSRFGYPTISIQMEGIISEMGDFFYRLAKKENVELKTKKGFQIGVVVVIPPFPFDDKQEFFIYKDLSILFKKPNLDGVHLGDVKIINGVWSIAGESGYALVITGSGITVDEARKQTYSRLKNIMLLNMYYRTDIGSKWLTDSDKLQTWGYLY
jgi:phosphoribosylamine--glycine ligase